jgi:isohexenylglutaconyl-CoA hydratase
MRFKSPEALRLGVVHQVVDSADALNEAITGTIKQLTRCAPMANIKTKALLHRVGTVDMEILLDQAADDFAQAVTGSEGSEGAKAFMQKRKPQWATSTN